MSDWLEVERYTIRVGCAVTGVSQEELEAALSNDGSPSSATAAPIDLEQLIEIIMEIILALLENCPQKSGYLQHVANPTRFRRVWFRRMVVRKINRGRTVEDNVLAAAMITEASKASSG